MTASSLEPVLGSLLAKAKAAGADAADVLATHGRALGITVRGGALEDIDNSEGRDIGLRVMIGQKQACVSSSDLSDTSLDALADRAVAMARLAPDDPYCGLADPELRFSGVLPDLDLFDPMELSAEDLKSRALEVEAAALSVAGVAQAEGSNANQSSSAVWFMTSDGFSGGWKASRHGLSVSAIAEQDGAMERDYDHDATRYLSDLRDAEEIGRQAGERAIARLGSDQMDSGALPVIFDQRVSGSFVSALIGAISGTSIARGVSFLKDKRGAQLFPDDIQIIDDPTLIRGHASRPFDGEGVTARRTAIIENGVLKNWLMNTSVARQLGSVTNGFAARGLSSPPGVGATNTFLLAGEINPEALMAETGHGLLVMEMFGPSLNSNTGDYSVGVSGFEIKNGQRAGPVSEVTLAGNLLDAFASLRPANDLIMDSSTTAPTVRVEGLTLAGR